MLKIGEKVCYGQSGLCKIEDRCEKEIAGQVQEYFVLTPLHKSGSVVYVPCANEELVGRMRKPLTSDEIETLLSRAAETETEWIRDFRRRSDIFKKALVSTDRMEALLLIKTVYEHRKESQGKGARLHTTDDYFLKDAEMLVYSEFAYVLEKEYEEVARYIRTLFSAEE